MSILLSHEPHPSMIRAYLG